MKEISFRLTDKKMYVKALGEFEPTKFNITLEVPRWFGESIMRLIKEEAKKWANK